MNGVKFDLGTDASSWYRASIDNNKDKEIVSQFTSFPKGMKVKADACVIGGGFTGLSAALELAKKGKKVILLEARAIGFGASGRNGGQVLGAFNKSYSYIAGKTNENTAKI